MQVFVLGYPSNLGGADTELWHVLRLWRQRGWDVTLIPTWRANPIWRERCDRLGIETVEVSDADWLSDVPGLKGASVVSFCNGEFLRTAGIFRQLGCQIVWVGCMTWLFESEREHYEAFGPFDAYVFQSEFQQAKLFAELSTYGVRPEQCFLIRGAFDTNEFAFAPRPHERETAFIMGRMARPDLDKWSGNTWKILDSVPYLHRRARLMGWSDRLAEKLGLPPDWAEVLSPCAETAHEFLKKLHCLLSINGGAEENWPRIGLEAMSTGVPIVAERQWGWREMIIDGETGLLAESEREFAESAARLANDEAYRQRIIRSARDRLCEELAAPASIFEQWRRLFEYVQDSARRNNQVAARRRVIIGVLSARGYDERRERCRRTWVRQAAMRAFVDVVFLLGDPEREAPERIGDLLYLPCLDDYDSLPQKTRLFCKWALSQGEFDYLFKCDDDTYVSIGRLLAFPSGESYVGCDMGGYASGGAGYLLDARAAGIVAERLVEPTGAEDLLVGRLLHEAGVSFTADARFGSWPRADQTPRRDNHMITGHGWRDDQMLAIHEALADTGEPTRTLRYCRIEEATTAQGERDLRGKQSFCMDAAIDVDLPSEFAGRSDIDVISVYASGRLVVFLKSPSQVTGSLARAFSLGAEPSPRFLVDGALVGELMPPHTMTSPVLLSAGRHELRTECIGDMPGRSCLWIVQPAERWPFRIAMITSDRYTAAAATSLKLLERFWPDHPPVDVVGHEKFPSIDASHGARLVPTGPQEKSAWTKSLSTYLRTHCRDEYVLLWLDDYGLMATPDRARLDIAVRTMGRDPTAASFHLTAMKLPTQLTYGDDPAAAAIICYPPWSYSVNLQAALWRRSSLLRLLDAVGAATAAEFELAASQHYNERLTDFEKHLSYRCNADTPLYLDADPRKSQWPLPYHNLMHAGSVDARHLDFLEAHGLNELLEWGQAEDAGTAFGSDYHVLAEFRRLVRDFNVQTIVETATRLGRTTEVLATLAEQVFSLAPGEALDARAIEDAKNLPNVQLLCGDAEKLLTDVLANVSGPVIAYLNIESTTGLHPIAVLGAIARSDCKPLIAIHGVHVPGTDYRFESLDGQDFRWEWLETSIRQIFGANGYLYYYNRQAAGARRGIVYVVPRGQS